MDGEKEVPDVVTFGGVQSCRCGWLTLGPVTGTEGVSVDARCPYCGTVIEALPDE